MGPGLHRRAQKRIQFLERVRDAKRLPEDALADPETSSPPNRNPAYQVLRMGKLHKEQDVPPRFACDQVPAEGRNRNSQGA